LLDVVTGEWNLGLCQTLGLPGRLFQKLIRPGEVYGYVRSEIGEKIGWTGVPVIAVAGHDTASAVAALPLRPGEAFVIAGSWSLVGVETVQPRIDDQVWRTGFGNEGGVGGRTTLIRSLPGLHLIQELRALWRSRTGLDVAYPEISARAAAAARENEAVDVNLSDPVFFNPVDIVDEIMRYSRQRDVTVTEDLGVVALAIYAGLAREIRSAVGVLERELGYELNSIMIGGGGARDATLCGMIERSVRQTVVVAPSEASALGNALLQLIGLGVLPSLDAGRELVERSPGLLSL
jgi:rhamnulokinase